jgi:hypothetical protein
MTLISSTLTAKTHKLTRNMVSGIKIAMGKNGRKGRRRMATTTAAGPSIDRMSTKSGHLANRIGNDTLKQIVKDMP